MDGFVDRCLLFAMRNGRKDLEVQTKGAEKNKAANSVRDPRKHSQAVFLTL